jgi:NAD(P)-dependent dehydrogenase (short-subunit alcohol dehydrogenase family)
MGALDGKVALITGAGSGIGKATVERFAAEGARICAVDFDDAAGDTVAKGVDGLYLHADAGDADEVAAAFATCERELGGVDITYLNAGIAIGVADMTALTDAEYHRTMRVNVDGVVWGTRAAIPAMQRRGGGAIVATSSLAGLIPFPLDPVYDLSKHAVVGFIRSVAPTLRPFGITANTVNPGMTDTNILSADAKALFEANDFPLMPATQIADAVLTIVTTGRTGECWVCQPGRDAEPYRFHDVPGPRSAGAQGRRPPTAV